MPESQPWEIDRVAAAQMLTALGIADTPEAARIAAGQLARHREKAMRWAVERARDRLVQDLERGAVDHYPRENEAWARGYGCAEMQVASVSADDLLDITQGAPRSPGQVLRGMIRAAKGR
ncbi:MAG: hypothetical protein KGL44_06720 [Sphingomonadales bacterium]|nr:hypothetical protein [Sphingomonadales bacterium]